MRIVQFVTADDRRAVARVESTDRLTEIENYRSCYDLAQAAIAAGRGLASLVEEMATGPQHNYGAVVAEDRLLAPLDHPDPAHFLITGTGLSHLGSADTRDQMHKKVAEPGEESLSDSMKMFRWGLEGGKPAEGATGVQPEWFYKGDGSIVAAPGKALSSPSFAEDGGEEPELVGLYLAGPDGTPWRIGFALGNEFSDHIMERRNYLYLAHSKLRPCAFGPELLIGDLPSDIRGKSRLLRGDNVVWEGEFLTGEDNMCHSIANLEHHHFKYSLFRRPGDLHAHFFGTATLSFAAGIWAEAGDIFEVSAPDFGRPLRNTLAASTAPKGGVQVL
ncbi:AraD1 family protein [Pelagibius sp. Alg239-R121]|uniref:AraD1 family protein n=1 Tax=Pelagibius sp. Alg239-R121 TaxID=2993448 RepID=UPI0024A67B09|nr:AraD1 family protein [Pelagibius sp. Alg239-R121]